MPSTAETTIDDLDVTGNLPAALSGRYLQVEPDPTGAVLHSLTLHGGRAVAYKSRRIATGTANRMLTFGSATFVFGVGGFTYALDTGPARARRVDLAGAHRGVAAVPRVDRFTGELHLVAVGDDAAQLHVTVSPGGHRRSVRPIEDAPDRITDLAVGYDRFVLLAGGFVGVTSRGGETERVIWVAAEGSAVHLVTAHDDGDSAVVYTTGPALERLTLHPATYTSHREVLDATPQVAVRNDERLSSVSVRHLWTITDRAAHSHDLLAGTRRDHDFGADHRPGELRFVSDRGCAHIDDGGWLVGFVHDEAQGEAVFVVLDARAIDRPAIATVRIPRRFPLGLHGTWVPATN